MLTPKRGLENDYRITITGSHYKWLLVFALLISYTRKRVFELSEAHLVAGDVLLKLVPYVFFYCLFISPYRVYIVSPAPEVPVAILVLEVSVTVEDHKATLTLKKPDEFRYCVLRRDCYVKMNMVG